MENKNQIPFITTDQMQEVDRVMMEDYGISLMQMMENAGKNLARLAQQRFLNEKRKGTIVILAGSGGNGGGALVCARYLQNWGYPVELCLAKPAESFKGTPLHQLNILLKLGIQVIALNQLEDDIVPSLIIDGLIGYSLAGTPTGDAAELISWANNQYVPIFSLDVPSGLDATLGYITDPVITANATMTLALPKTGLAVESARPYVGELYLADIGVPPMLYQELSLNLNVGPLFNEKSIIQLW